MILLAFLGVALLQMHSLIDVSTLEKGDLIVYAHMIKDKRGHLLHEYSENEMPRID